MHRYSHQESVIVGTPFGNRLIEETQDMMGCFINTLPIASTVDPEQSFETLLEQMRKTLNEVYTHLRNTTHGEEIVWLLYAGSR